jgi:hypothetical protein
LSRDDRHLDMRIEEWWEVSDREGHRTVGRGGAFVLSQKEVRGFRKSKDDLANHPAWDVLGSGLRRVWSEVYEEGPMSQRDLADRLGMLSRKGGMLGIQLRRLASLRLVHGTRGASGKILWSSDDSRVRRDWLGGLAPGAADFRSILDSIAVQAGVLEIRQARERVEAKAREDYKKVKAKRTR